MKTLNRRSGVALTFLAGMVALPAVGADADRLNQRVWLQLGAFRPNIDSSLRVDRSTTGLDGSTLDFEDELALPKTKTLPTLLLGARINDRWRAEFEYFRLSRHADQDLLSVPVNVGDTTYPVAATVATRFESQVYRAGIGYSFLKTPQTELGAVVGLHVTKFQIELAGTGSVGGATVATAIERQDRTVPLPTLGYYGTSAIAPNWKVGGRLDVLALKVGDYRGRLLNVQANLQYRFTENIAVGAGYRYDDYRLSADRDTFKGRIDYRFSGPQLFVEAGF